MLCPKCHKAVVPGGKFCGACGVRLAEEQDTPDRILPVQKVCIGRSSECDIVFSDPSVSRKHCTVEKMSDGSYFLCDLKSRNGTFVDGVQIRKKHINAASRIRLGSLDLLGADILLRFPQKEHVPEKQPEKNNSALYAISAIAAAVLLVLLILPGQKNDKGNTMPDRVPAIETSMQDIERATAIVMVRDYGYRYRLGSGFFVNDRIIVTNRHVVENAQSILVGNKHIGTHEARVFCMARNGQGDFAALDAGISNAVSLPLSTSAGRNEKVYAWGYPGLLVEAINWNGLPDVVSTSGEINVIRNGRTNLIVHSAKISPGNSGGPLINEKGCVVGINTLMLDDPNRGQYYVSFASSDLITFLDAYDISYRKR